MNPRWGRALGRTLSFERIGAMLNRRQFVSSLSTATASITLGRAVGAASPTKESDRLGELLPTRRFGPTGEQLTVLGLGGGHLGKQSPREAQESIETCLEGGVRFFDNAEAYEKGLSEEYYGRFLTPKYRDTIYLLTKTTARDAKTARRHLEGSLRRMKTDHIDSYNMHSVTSADDVDERLDKGVLDVLLEAREKGTVRHIGFTGHATPEAHRRMLERTKVLQSCLMPINVKHQRPQRLRHRRSKTVVGGGAAAIVPDNLLPRTAQCSTI
ncbi:MAG: aldo/keto reductase, partial [bacterium]